MKKLTIIIMAMIMAVGLTACNSDGVTQEEYDSVVDELNGLKDDNSSLNEMLRPRISEFPVCKAVASEWDESIDELIDFMDTWVPDIESNTALTPQDFLCYNESLGFLWFKVLPDDIEETKGFELIEFSGGLYVSAIAVDEDINDLNKTISYLKNWVNEQENFELDFSSGRYQMTHVITSDKTSKALGYGQLEVFIPIKRI